MTTAASTSGVGTNHPAYNERVIRLFVVATMFWGYQLFLVLAASGYWA